MADTGNANESNQWSYYAPDSAYSPLVATSWDDGNANTQNYVAARGAYLYFGWSAVSRCVNMGAGWFLPAINEALLIAGDVTGMVRGGQYWSSTQKDNYNSYLTQNQSAAYTNNWQNPYPVRCARRD